jgi:very-short-patch-repair endonuclease
VVELARKLRRERTGVERILWTRLRLFKGIGFHFRRQHPIGPYVVDFACMSARLVIEVDGPTQDPQLEVPRQAFIERQGWTVLRFTADEVLRDVDEVTDGIYGHLTDPPTPTLPQGEGEPVQP